jgi:hypothetical protein
MTSVGFIGFIGAFSRDLLTVALCSPMLAVVILGSRSEEQLLETLDATGWVLTVEQVAQLDEASAVKPSHPTDFYSTADRPRNQPMVGA